MEQLLSANKRALKNIKASNAKNKKVIGGKDLVIPIGNLVLLRDHPEGRNKIQDNNKDQLFVVTGHHQHPNAYYIQPLNKKESPKQVNRRELFDLGITEEQEEEREKEEEEEEKKDNVPSVPIFKPQIARKRDNIETNHPYNLRPRGPVPKPRRSLMVTTKA